MRGGVIESPPGIYGTEKTVRSDEVDTFFVSFNLCQIMLIRCVVNRYCVHCSLLYVQEVVTYFI